LRDSSRWWMYLQHLSSTVCVSHGQNYLLHSSLVIYFFSNPTHETGTANRCRNTNTKPLGTSQYDGPTRNTQHQSDHIYYTLFSTCTMLVCLWPVTANHGIMLSHNHFPEPNRHVLTFLHLIFLCMTIYTRHCWRCSWVFSEWRMQIEKPKWCRYAFCFSPMKARKH